MHQEKFIQKVFLLLVFMTSGMGYASGQSCPTTDLITVVVHQDPDVTLISLDQTICTGGELVLEATAQFGTGVCGLQWQRNIGSGWTDIPGAINTTFNTGPLSQTTDYRVVMSCSGSNCDSDISNDITITVLNLPSISISSVPGVCNGSPIDLTAVATGGLGGFTYQWQHLNPQGIYENLLGETNALLSIGSLVSSKTYRLVLVGSGVSCSNEATKKVIAWSIPNAVVASNAPFCAPQNLNLQASGGALYSWDGPNGYLGTGATRQILGATTTHSGTYTVTVTSTDGCSISKNLSVVISPCGEICNNGWDDDNDGLADCQDLDCGVGPFDLASSGDGQFCEGGSVVFTVPSLYTRLWSNGSVDPSITVINSGTYTVTVTNANACTAQASRDVSVWPAVVSTIDPVVDFCQFQTMTITSTGGLIHNWSGPNQFSYHTTPLIIKNVQPSQSGWYMLTASNQYGCTNVDSVLVTIKPAPAFVDATGGRLTCTVNEVVLMGQTTTVGSSYAWSGPGGFTAATATVPTSVEGTYTVTVTGTNGCTATDKTQVKKDQTIPELELNTDWVITCASDTLYVMGKSKPSALQYIWSGPDGFTSTAAEAQITVPGTYTVLATNPLNDCVVQKDITVTVNKAAPIVTATGGEIKCDSPLCLLTASGNVPSKFIWHGPNNYTSTVQTPLVGVPGTYNVHAISDETGCTSLSDDAEVIKIDEN
jgi:hypothetical protein